MGTAVISLAVLILPASLAYLSFAFQTGFRRPVGGGGLLMVAAWGAASVLLQFAGAGSLIGFASLQDGPAQGERVQERIATLYERIVWPQSELQGEPASGSDRAIAENGAATPATAEDAEGGAAPRGGAVLLAQGLATGVVALVFGLALGKLAAWGVPTISEAAYGPLAALVTGFPRPTVWVSVVSNIQFPPKDARVVYHGMLVDFRLGDDETIDYVSLAFAQKTTMMLAREGDGSNDPHAFSVVLGEAPVSIGRSAHAAGHETRFVIEGEDIANVFFERLDVRGMRLAFQDSGDGAQAASAKDPPGEADGRNAQAWRWVRTAGRPVARWIVALGRYFPGRLISACRDQNFFWREGGRGAGALVWRWLVSSLRWAGLAFALAMALSYAVGLAAG